MKRFFSKKLNIVSMILAVLGLVGVLVMLIVPHGAKYERKYTELEKEITQVYEIKDGKIYSSTMIDGKYTVEDLLLGEYTINGGKISYKVPLTGVSVEFGEINAFRYKAGDVEYTCVLTNIFFAVACVMTLVGGVGIVYGAVSTKKKTKSKSKKK